MIRPSMDRFRGGIDRYPPVLGGGVRLTDIQYNSKKSIEINSNTRPEVKCLHREYEVNGEDS